MYKEKLDKLYKNGKKKFFKDIKEILDKGNKKIDCNSKSRNIKIFNH